MNIDLNLPNTHPLRPPPPQDDECCDTNSFVSEYEDSVRYFRQAGKQTGKRVEASRSAVVV